MILFNEENQRHHKGFTDGSSKIYNNIISTIIIIATITMHHHHHHQHHILRPCKFLSKFYICLNKSEDAWYFTSIKTSYFSRFVFVFKFLNQISFLNIDVFNIMSLLKDSCLTKSISSKIWETSQALLPKIFHPPPEIISIWKKMSAYHRALPNQRL